MLTIEVNRCAGCGACVQACPQGAISLVDGVAQIDSSLCTECQACVNVCPKGAIRVAVPVAEQAIPVATQEEKKAVVSEERPPITAVSRGTLATLAAATLSLLGRYLLPRAADAFISALERRSSRPSFPASGANVTTVRGAGKRGGRRRRHRGGW